MISILIPVLFFFGCSSQEPSRMLDQAQLPQLSCDDQFGMCLQKIPAKSKKRKKKSKEQEICEEIRDHCYTEDYNLDD